MCVGGGPFYPVPESRVLPQGMIGYQFEGLLVIMEHGFGRFL